MIFHTFAFSTGQSRLDCQEVKTLNVECFISVFIRPLLCTFVTFTVS